MPRKSLYPEGRDQMNIIVSAPVKKGIENVARKRRQSASQVASLILEDYLRDRGELPKPNGKREKATVA